MKNKIISAMLVGMSATMAVPATAVFAADETEPSAVEEVAAETPAVEETAEPTESVDEDASEEVSAQEAEAEMVGYASDEAQKVADTPTDFTTKLSNITFSADTFGKYGEQLTSFVTGEEIDKSSLYNTEMAVIEKVQKIAIDESTEAVRAMKYAIALVFENTYGEDAFQPGRDIRRARDSVTVCGLQNQELHSLLSTSSENISACLQDRYCNGILGVPITYLDKYSPEQFEIIGMLQSSTDEQAGIQNLRFYNNFREMRQDMSYTGASGGKANGNPVIKEKPKKGNFLYNEKTGEYVHSVYARIVIRRKL